MVCAGNCRDKVKHFDAPGNEFLSSHLFCAHLYCFIFSKKKFSKVANTARRVNKRYSCFVCFAFSGQLYIDFRFFLPLLINSITSETVKEQNHTRSRVFTCEYITQFSCILFPRELDVCINVEREGTPNPTPTPSSPHARCMSGWRYFQFPLSKQSP